MEFRLLGELGVVHQGREVPVPEGKRRAVLAMLLLHAREVVSSDRLIEALWGEALPSTPQKTLQMHVSGLRKMLAEAGGAQGGDGLLVTQGSGYVLRVGDDMIDARCFERAVAAGRRELDDSRPEEAAQTLRDALALWRGPALAGLEYELFAQSEIARLEELRVGALEGRIDADLELGRHRELVAELEALTTSHPLWERPWAQLMLALYRSGRQADALGCFQRARSRLVEEVGIEPGAELQSLQRAILAQDPTLLGEGGPRRDHVSSTSTVTVLFTDLERSTELLARLGDEGAERLRRTHFGVLREALAEHGGSEVKTLGDGVMAVFDSALAGAACAVAMQRAVAGHNAEQPNRQLSLRVGLNVGEAIRAEDDYFGTPVVIAARLCDRAGGGEILASQLVQSLAQGRVGARFRDAGSLSLKGLADPVPVAILDWADATVTTPGAARVDEEPMGAAAPFPPALAREEPSAFVGRNDALRRLEHLVARARGGGRELALIAGEPGVGKTRLAAEVARRAHEEGVPVLYGRCSEEVLVPYQPFVEALDPIAAAIPSVSRDDDLAPAAAIAAARTAGGSVTDRS